MGGCGKEEGGELLAAAVARGARRRRQVRKRRNPRPIAPKAWARLGRVPWSSKQLRTSPGIHESVAFLISFLTALLENQPDLLAAVAASAGVFPLSVGPVAAYVTFDCG